MKYTSVSTLVVSLALAGWSHPASAASLPIDAAKDQSATARLEVENAVAEPSATPWVAVTRLSAGRSFVGVFDETSALSAPWRAALAADASSMVNPAANPASLVTGSLVAEPLAADFGLPTADEVAEIGVQYVSPAPGPRSDSSRFSWKLLWMVMPALGGVFIAWDARFSRHKRRGLAAEHVCLEAGPPDVPFVPSALAALGLGADASEEDVKRAFRQRAKSAHPDRGGDARGFMALQSHFEQSLRIVRAAAIRASLRTASRQAA